MATLARRRLAAIVMTGLLVTPILDQSLPHAGANTLRLDATTQPAQAGSPLDLWNAGKKNAAVAGFIAADWTNGGFLPADPILGLTEAQFDQKVASDPNLQQEMTIRTDSLKSLAREVLTRGDGDAKNAKSDDARACFTNLQAFGTYLSSHDGELAILKLVGTAYKKAAADRLAKLPPVGQ